ncbi:MAG: VWA domain-containing protein [Bryobacterales bacterium]|nr:VWA domain-containing protein [Bryobacterales bacterium]
MTSAASMFAPVAAPTGLPIRLAMQRLWLTGEVLPAGARLTVEHVFQSDEDHPLEVIYPFPLPRDAALRRFRIVAGSCETHSDLIETAEAVKAYELAIEQGSLSALARQYGDGLVNLTVGNIRPREMVTVHVELLAGVELRDDGFRFRFPFTLAPSYHSQMRAVTAGGGVELELPAGFGDLILPPFLEDASSLHQVGFALSVRHGAALGEIGSPSHAIRVAPGPAGLTRVMLAPEKDVPDRDFVLDVRFSEDTPQVLSGPSGDGKCAFAIVVPSSRFGSRTEQARRVAILLDRSGSMSGEPIAQARKAVEACLAALSEQDEFLLVAFDDRVETAHAQPVPATREHREAARAFLQGIGARGGTELASAVEQAARALGAGDIFLITDGQVFGTETILAEARSVGARLSCLGVGSASQDRFLSLLARETGGVSRFVTPRERVDLAAIDLFAALGRPLASGLRAAHVEPAPPPVVFAGTPVLLFGELEADSAGHIDLAWDGGSMSLTVPSGAPETGETVRLLRGSRLITDWESRHANADAPSPLEKRQQKRVAARLLQLSRTYGLASREMSLVAVVKREGDRSGELPETRVVPVGVPQDTEISMEAFLVSGSLFSVDPELALGKTRGRDAAAVALARFDAQPPATESAACCADLIDLASMLEPDGGMPGDSPEARAARTVAAVLAFVAGGHTLRSGAFRRHLARLVEFLKPLSTAPETDARLIATALDAAETGHAPDGPWLSLACDPGTRWKQLGRPWE